jgi:hypothetical protein
VFAVTSTLSVDLRYDVRQLIGPLGDTPGVIRALLINVGLTCRESHASSVSRSRAGTSTVQ